MKRTANFISIVTLSATAGCQQPTGSASRSTTAILMRLGVGETELLSAWRANP